MITRKVTFLTLAREYFIRLATLNKFFSQFFDLQLTQHRALLKKENPLKLLSKLMLQMKLLGQTCLRRNSRREVIWAIVQAQHGILVEGD